MLIYTIILAVFLIPAPAAITALYFVADGGPRPGRCWSVPRHTFRRSGLPLLAAWLLGAALHLVLLWIFWTQIANSSNGLLAALIAMLWIVVVAAAVGVGGAAHFRSTRAGAVIGVTTWLCMHAPYIVAIIDIFALPIAALLAAVIWNAVVIATIVRAESPALRQYEDF